MGMKSVALGIALVGIAILLFLLYRPYSEEIVNIESLEGLTPNTKVMVEGIVSSERIFDDFRILVIKNIPVVCGCKTAVSLEGKEVRVIGLIEEYEGEREIQVLELTVLE